MWYDASAKQHALPVCALAERTAFTVSVLVVIVMVTAV